MDSEVRGVIKRQGLGVFIVFAFMFFFTVPAESAWQPYKGGQVPRVLKSPPILTEQVNDPVGDTFGSGPVQIDMTYFSAFYTATELIISVSFKDPVSLPDSGQPNAVIGYVDFDTDRNPATGAISHVDIFSPYASGLGVEYYASFDDYSSVTHDTGIYDSGDNLVGRARVSFEAKSFTMKIPLALIGNSNGYLNTATVIGTLDEATDAAPNEGFISSSPPPVVPALSEWSALFCLILMASAGIIMIRRRMNT
jgi:hypothetical protein